MTAQYKKRGLALGLAAALLASAPGVAALAQPYDQGYGPPPGDQGYGPPPPGPGYGPPPPAPGYGPPPPYQGDQYRQAGYEEQRRAYDAQYGDGAFDRYQQYQSDQQARADQACRQDRQGNEVGGALLGGIAGAVLGSNLGRGGGREGGAIIGGVGGAAGGAAIAGNATHC